MTKLYTTLNLLREHQACKSGYAAVLKAVGLAYDKDAKIDLRTVLDSNGLRDTLWSLRATIDSGEVMGVCASFANWCTADAAAYAAAYAEAYDYAYSDCESDYASAVYAVYATTYAADAYSVIAQTEKLREMLS